MQQAQKRSGNRSFQIFSRQASVFPIAALGLPQKPSFELADYRCYRCPSSATSWPNGCFGNAPTSAFVGNVQSLWSGLKPATSLMPSMVNGPMSWVKHEDPREEFGWDQKDWSLWRVDLNLFHLLFRLQCESKSPLALRPVEQTEGPCKICCSWETAITAICLPENLLSWVFCSLPGAIGISWVRIMETFT